jgi:succinoglycan biosynthesis protein ExoU
LTPEENRPLASVIMANLNGEAYVADAVRSVLNQSLVSLELILSDDGSTDASLERARTAAGSDERLRIVEGPSRSGPAAARNRALAVARGEWIAVVDSDDVLHPERLERLVAAAERDRADIVADDLVIFYEDGSRAPRRFLPRDRAHEPTWTTASEWVLGNVIDGRSTLGNLKPVIRRAAAPDILAYDEMLRIGEDFDLIARLLIAGAWMRIYPEPLYFYRKHSSSISHRWSASSLATMIDANDRLAATSPPVERLRAALEIRRASLRDEAAFVDLIAALKAGEWKSAARIALEQPSVLWRLRTPVLERLRATLIQAPPLGGPPTAARGLLPRSRRDLSTLLESALAFAAESPRPLPVRREEVSLAGAAAEDAWIDAGRISPLEARGRVAVIIAAYNARETIAAAVRSALAQPEVAEVCVVDDASTDGTAEVARASADGDSRAKVISQQMNAGPAAARNVAINATTAPWIAILDADDYLLPGRMGGLLQRADHADFVADVLLRDRGDGTPPAAAWDLGPGGARAVDFEALVNGNLSLPGKTLELGFLKPLIRRSFLDDNGLRYRDMRLGEDYELYARALALGARFLIAPAAGYVSVERAGSLSKSHTAEDLRRLRDCDDEIAKIRPLSAAERRALRRRTESVDCRLQWRLLISAYKARDWDAAVKTFRSPPITIYLFARLADEIWGRVRSRLQPRLALLVKRAGR